MKESSDRSKSPEQEEVEFFHQVGKSSPIQKPPKADEPELILHPAIIVVDPDIERQEAELDFRRLGDDYYTEDELDMIISRAIHISKQ